MSEWLTLYAGVAKTAVLCSGLVIVFYTARAARHTGDDGLWLLSVGIFLTGLGLFFHGVLSAVLGVGPHLETALTSTVSAVGLAIVVYSIFTEVHIPASRS